MNKANTDLKATLHFVDKKISDLVCKCVFDHIMATALMIFLLSGSICNDAAKSCKNVHKSSSHRCS